MNGDLIIKTAEALGIAPPQVFERCAAAHGLRQAEVVASDRHLEWQGGGEIPDYVTRWCIQQTIITQQQNAEGHPLFI